MDEERKKDDPVNITLFLGIVLHLKRVVSSPSALRAAQIRTFFNTCIRNMEVTSVGAAGEAAFCA